MTERIEPGRELDSLVAKVMGWTNIAEYGYDARDRYYQGPAGLPPNHSTEFTLAIPKYSTDPAAAFDAWEWLDKNYPGLMLGRREDGKPSVCGVQYDVETFTIGETYTHAIALAVVRVGEIKEL